MNARRLSPFCGLLLAALVATGSNRSTAAPVISAGGSGLTITDIGAPYFNTGGSQSGITQMTWGPGPDPTKQYLYFSSDTKGIRRLEYNPATATFSGSLTTVNSTSGNGIAFQGSDMYVTNHYTSSGKSLSALVRLRDTNGDGVYGESVVPIVQGIPRDDHGINQIVVKDKSLYVGIGVRTHNGAYDTYSGDTYGESAYNGTIAVIDDVTLVPQTANAAGFYTPNPTVAQYEALIQGTNPVAPSPFTTTDPAKLRIHSSGTRNPFGIALDGEGKVWFTNNQQRVRNTTFDRNNVAGAEPDAWQGDGLHNDIHDQMFQAVDKGDYGYRISNWQNNATAQAAGYFDPAMRQSSYTFDNYRDPVAPNETDHLNPAYNQVYSNSNPSGLGVSSSSNGFDFNSGNTLPLKYHKDAFITRWTGTVSDGGQSVTYRDVVTMDYATGKITRVAEGFSQPLDTLSDANGNVLVADRGGSIYVIKAAAPQVGAHAITWGGSSGNWSDRLSWNTASPADDRLVPHQWQGQSYAVTIDRPGDNTVEVNQDVKIHALVARERINIQAGRTFQADQLQGDGLIIDGPGAFTMTGADRFSITNGGTVYKRGSGTLTLKGTNQHVAGAQLNVEGGFVDVSATGADPLGNAVRVNVSPDASLRVTDGTTTVGLVRPGATGAGQVEVASGSTLKLAPHSTLSHRLKTLALAGGAIPTAAVDLIEGTLIVDFDDNLPAPIQQFFAQVKAGFADGAWNGNGIRSSTAAANPGQVTIGAGLASTLGWVGSGVAPLDSADLLATDALVARVTLYGDANLDLVLDGQDYATLASNYGEQSGALWTDGDFNYDGKVDFADYSLFISQFGPEGAALYPEPVPEPATLVLLGCGMVALWAARRRRR